MLAQTTVYTDDASTAVGLAAGTFLIIFVVGIAIAVVFGVICMKLFEKKGYSKGLGFVCGFFLSWIGLIIALVIQDKTQQQAAYYGGGYPQPQAGYPQQAYQPDPSQQWQAQPPQQQYPPQQ